MEQKEFNCPNCNRKLHDVRAQDDRIDFWCDKCRVQFDQDFFKDREELTNYTKFSILLNFVKDLAYPKDNDPAWIGKKHFERVARELLKQIGEDKSEN